MLEAYVQRVHQYVFIEWQSVICVICGWLLLSHVLVQLLNHLMQLFAKQCGEITSVQDF
jgi:hypothetical protein